MPRKKVGTDEPSTETPRSDAVERALRPECGEDAERQPEHRRDGDRQHNQFRGHRHPFQDQPHRRLAAVVGQRRDRRAARLPDSRPYCTRIGWSRPRLTPQAARDRATLIVSGASTAIGFAGEVDQHEDERHHDPDGESRLQYALAGNEARHAALLFALHLPGQDLLVLPARCRRCCRRCRRSHPHSTAADRRT